MPGMGTLDSHLKPTFELEAAELQLHGGPVAGVDEAGRGPLAGPVVAAAVILDPERIPDGINDSKVLDEDDREVLYGRIRSTSIIGVGIADVDRIDRDNILGATMWAMAQAIAQASERNDARLTEIMLAQDFHDLTGQVVARVVQVAATIEEQLLALLLESAPAGKPGQDRVLAPAYLQGPVVESEGRTDIVTNQAQVDDLLASLGF